MAIKLGDAIVYLRGDRGPLQKDLAGGEKDAKAWTVAVGTMAGNLMSQVIAGGARLAISMVQSLGSELRDMVFDAAKLEGTRNTFDKLAESVGGNAAVALEQLREATRGMVADADLMLAGNKFLAMGLAETTEGAAELAEIATQLGTAMGEDATASMENFALMMANQSIPRLDSFGISSGKVRERINELMAATEGLTREQAFNQAVMEQARVTMEKVGEQSGTSASKIAAMQATFENLKLTAGQALQPILDVFVEIGSNIVETWGPRIQQWFEDIKPAIEGVANVLRAIAAGDFGGVLSGIEQALTALGVPKETVEKVVTILNTLWSAFQDLRAGNIEEFIGKVKAVLLELGIPIETIDKLEAAFRSAFGWAQENIPKIAAAIKATWDNLLKPALEGLWLLIKDNIKPILIALGTVFLVTVGPALLATVGPILALGVALTALGLLWKEYGEQVQIIIEQLGFIISHYFQEAIKWITDLWDKITSFQLPDWLTPGSATPFEEGIRGITDAMKELSTLGVPQLQAAFAGVGNQSQITNHNYYLTAQYRQMQSESSLVDDVRALSILTGGR